MSTKAKAKPTQSGLESSEMVARQAMEATRSAYLRALQASSKGVLRTHNGNLVRVSRDGSIEVVGKAKPRRKVTVGQVVAVRSIEGQVAGHSA
ncbi:hypothetical protein ACSVIJ_12035 [Pseudomonas sp. NCHU5208]|uniref:hypothetical protein n=1 Tax=unclassified Pseudomonas TaxID=196821 RepID=UPI003F9721DE